MVLSLCRCLILIGNLIQIPFHLYRCLILFLIRIRFHIVILVLTIQTWIHQVLASCVCDTHRHTSIHTSIPHLVRDTH